MRLNGKYVTESVFDKHEKAEKKKVKKKVAKQKASAKRYAMMRKEEAKAVDIIAARKAYARAIKGIKVSENIRVAHPKQKAKPVKRASLGQKSKGDILIGAKRVGDVGMFKFFDGKKLTNNALFAIRFKSTQRASARKAMEKLAKAHPQYAFKLTHVDNTLF